MSPTIFFSGADGYSVYGESGNHVTVEYNCNNGNGYSGVTTGPGTITSNPMFVNPNAGDFHLQTGSACINAGNPAALYNDPDGTRNDMGAFGGNFTAPRQVRVVSATGVAGETVVVPVKMTAMGNERSLDFSVTYDSTTLLNPQVTLGPDTTNATLVVNTQQTGRVGVLLYAKLGQTFASGNREMVRMAFAIDTNAPMGITPITFADKPTALDVSDNMGQSLSVGWLPGAVSITWGGYESDVVIRPTGDGRLLSGDVIQVARFVVGLDVPTAAECMRADCAPRTNKSGIVTLGNGVLTGGDVIQAERYVVGLDPTTPIGGPLCVCSNLAASKEIVPFLNAQLSEGDRSVRIVDAAGAVGRTVIVPVKMAARGDESSLSFSLRYDLTVLSNPRLALGADAASARLAVNTQEVGQVGVLIYLDVDQTFAAGDLELARVTFDIAASAPAGDTLIGFTDMPARMSSSDKLGGSLSVTWLGGLVRLIGPGDSDGDGMSDWAEDLAGTNPDDSNSCFKLEFPAASRYAINSNGVVLQWFSASNRVYHLYQSTNLTMSNNGFYPIPPTDIQATPTLNTYTDTTATGIGPYFYKIEVEKR